MGAAVVGGFVFPLPFPFFRAGPSGAPLAKASGAAGRAGLSDWGSGAGWASSSSHGMSVASSQIWEGDVGGGSDGWAPEEQVEPRTAESKPIRSISAWCISGLGAPSPEAVWKQSERLFPRIPSWSLRGMGAIA